jgi:hypothetical protein
VTLRCEGCGEPAIEPDARFCIACGGRLVEVDEPVPAPEPDPGGSSASDALESARSVPPRPVREEDVPVALVVAGVIAVLVVLLALLLLT